MTTMAQSCNTNRKRGRNRRRHASLSQPIGNTMEGSIVENAWREVRSCRSQRYSIDEFFAPILVVYPWYAAQLQPLM